MKPSIEADALKLARDGAPKPKPAALRRGQVAKLPRKPVPPRKG